MNLSGPGQKNAASGASRSVSIVSHFLCGRKDSARVRTALRELLGCEPFEALAAASRDHNPPEEEGGAA